MGEREPESNIKINSGDMVFTTFSILLGYVCKKNKYNIYMYIYYTGTILSQEEPEAGGKPVDISCGRGLKE